MVPCLKPLTKINSKNKTVRIQLNLKQCMKHMLVYKVIYLGCLLKIHYSWLLWWSPLQWKEISTQLLVRQALTLIGVVMRFIRLSAEMRVKYFWFPQLPVFISPHIRGQHLVIVKELDKPSYSVLTCEVTQYSTLNKKICRFLPLPSITRSTSLFDVETCL